MTDQAAMRAFYFGTVGRAGHYWHDETLRHARFDGPWPGKPSGYPWPYVDGHFTESKGKQGVASVHHSEGWTVLAMADYTVDSRPGSNSVFVFDATLDWDEALIAAKERFPRIVARIGEIVRD